MPLMSTRTPAMIRNATPGSLRPTVSMRAALVIGFVLACASVVRADVASVDQAATVAAPADRILVSGPGLLFPMSPSPKCDVLNNFGGMSKLYGGGRHQGVDIGSTLGQEVYAVEDGRLYRQFTLPADSAAGNGWSLIAGASNTQYRYYHLSGFAPGLAVGSTVRKGQVIGYVGVSGNAPKNTPHLHFAIFRLTEAKRWWEGTPIDPFDVLR